MLLSSEPQQHFPQMLLGLWDWACIATFFIVSLAIGVSVARRAGSSSKEFFNAGTNMPWWLLGVSMVATTFSTDVPNLVTDIVRTHSIAGNWLWWSFLLTGMMTVFIYARLWRRSNVLTDIEFYELRYSGKSAAFLRGFRALYLGVLFNVFIMASTSLAAIKIGRVLLGLEPIHTIFIAGVVTVIYSSLGGLRGVLITDFLQFIITMIGSVAAAYIALQQPQVGGLSGLLSHETVRESISMFPDFSDEESLIALFIIPLTVSWWSVWYPGAEPGGGGYIAQRMLAAKNEEHAVGAVFLFNVIHYAIRPWPWIVVALCSMVVFPDIPSLQAAFPHAASLVGNDMAYPAMLTFLPTGLLGLVVASLIAAYMSTISTHLNWGASYVVHDFYQRFVRTDSSEKELVLVGRICTFLLMIFSGILAISMESALDNFQIILQIGAGTGLIFILRWFWWRINSASEIAAMCISFLVAVYFRLVHPWTGLPELNASQELVLGVLITTTGWILVTFITKPTDHETLVNFCQLVQPGGPGWKAVMKKAQLDDSRTDEFRDAWQVPQGILCMILGCVSVYSILFATGYLIYGKYLLACGLTVLATLASLLLVNRWRKLSR